MTRLPVRFVLAGCFVAAVSAQDLPKDLGPLEYYRPPQLAVMAEFTKDPAHKHYSMEEWRRGLGGKFDAQAFVARCKRAGAVEIIWVDKWIDGLVFHDTKTTSYKAERDFLGELSRECRKQGVKLLAYFNTFYDDNPEFAAWRALDQRGRPLVLSPGWPSALVSMYSPYREKIFEQIRELLVDYNVDGLWFDVPKYPSISYDKWSQEAFRKQFGRAMEDAMPLERRKFSLDSTVQWSLDVAAYARKVKPSAILVPHGFFDPLNVGGPNYAIRMVEHASSFTVELHTGDAQEALAGVLAGMTKPAEAGSLISDFWFTPLEGAPPKTSKSGSESLAEVATVFTTGLNLYLALVLGHDGTADEATLALLDQAGAWLKSRRPYLQAAKSYSDVGIVLGTANGEDRDWPGASGPEGAGSFRNVLDLGAIEAHLRRSGFAPRRFLTSRNSRKWDSIPPGIRTLIVPDRVSLTAEDAQKVRDFATRGGTVLAFGRGVSLGVSGMDVGKADEIFGIRSAGYVLPNPWADGTRLELNGKFVPLQALLIHTRPTTAETVLWAENRIEGGMPGLTRNRTGVGKAYFCAVAESALAGKPEVMSAIWKETIGEPLWRIPEESGRYRVRLREQRGRRLIHVIDSLPGIGGQLPRNRSRYITLDLNTREFPFRSARLEPEGRDLQVAESGEWKSFSVYPDPEVTVVLEP
ncbi:MAG: alpha-L-fucosidase [Acidobacteria bacterium]|nr:alpha-L-fucosidase [Acidobacteriota bacterium]